MEGQHHPADSAHGDLHKAALAGFRVKKTVLHGILYTIDRKSVNRIRHPTGRKNIKTGIENFIKNR